MNIKTKLTLVIGALVAMIVLLVSLSIVNLQILTATEPNSPAAGRVATCITLDFDYWRFLYCNRYFHAGSSSFLFQ